MSALRAHSRCIREDPFLLLLCPIAVIITRSSSGSYSGCGQVLLLRADGCPKVWVATSDSFHQQAAHGSGAYVWNCKTLISEVLSGHVVFFVSSLVPVC
jgi:hypothetical protein